MNIKPIPALLTTALLAACGGGGGGGMVQSPPPSTVVVNPPPPSGAEPEPCTSPATADCTVNVATSVTMWDGRTSDYALRKQGAGDLRLETGTYRYGAGTTVEAGRLVINSVARLESNTFVETGGALEVWGVLIGDIDNHGSVTQSAMVEGNVANHGQLNVDGSIWDPLEVIITGDYLHARDATLAVIVGTQPGGLTVKGRADIEGGVLRLGHYTDAWGPYPLPAAPSTHRVLHADGGVFGTFDEWTSPSLFITGALRYLTNDIYFDATTLSAQAVMKTANAGDALTLQTAGRYDAALAVPRNTAALTQTQQQFLHNAAAIQRIDNFAQAMRTFDSLSGHGHITAAEATMTQALRTAPTLSQHAANGIGKERRMDHGPRHDVAARRHVLARPHVRLRHRVQQRPGDGSSVAWTTANSTWSAKAASHTAMHRNGTCTCIAHDPTAGMQRARSATATNASRWIARSTSVSPSAPRTPNARSTWRTRMPKAAATSPWAAASSHRSPHCMRRRCEATPSPKQATPASN